VFVENLVHDLPLTLDFFESKEVGEAVASPILRSVELSSKVAGLPALRRLRRAKWNFAPKGVPKRMSLSRFSGREFGRDMDG